MNPLILHLTWIWGKIGKRKISSLPSPRQVSQPVWQQPCLTAPLDATMSVFLLKLASLSAQCPADQPPCSLPSLSTENGKKKQNDGGSDLYYLYVKTDYRPTWDLSFLIQSNAHFRRWCYKGYQQIPKQLNDPLNHSRGPNIPWVLLTLTSGSTRLYQTGHQPGRWNAQSHQLLLSLKERGCKSNELTMKP